MGKHSNILLVDKSSSKVLEVIKHIGFSQNSYRTLLPGATYIAPTKYRGPQSFYIKDEKLFEILQTRELTAKNLQSLFQGLGRDTAIELENLLTDDRLSKFFVTFFKQETNPCLTDKSFSCVPFSTKIEGHFSSLSQLLDVFYKDKAERDRVKQQASELIRRVENNFRKTATNSKNRKKNYWRQTMLKNFAKKGNC